MKMDGLEPPGPIDSLAREPELTNRNSPAMDMSENQADLPANPTPTELFLECSLFIQHLPQEYVPFATSN